MTPLRAKINSIRLGPNSDYIEKKVYNEINVIEAGLRGKNN